MKTIDRRTLLLLAGLLLATSAAMGFTARQNTAGTPAPGIVALAHGTVAVDAHLVQDKVLVGSDGLVTLGLTLQASEADTADTGHPAPADLVIVLDRSGSMSGPKLNDARRAVQALIDTLAPNDRLGLVTYSEGPELVSDLRPLTAGWRRELKSRVADFQPGGGTNLGGGLEAGLALFAARPEGGRHRKLVLISDGLANHGVTDPDALGRMAAAALSRDWVVSTVGVGNDFNEHLMTSLADQGGGRYTYLEEPAAFAAAFQQEYRRTVAAAVSGMTVSIPLPHGVRLIEAGGYPVTSGAGRASFNPGGLRFGQRRTLYLTFAIPTGAPGQVPLEDLRLTFYSGDDRVTATLAETFTVACVDNRDEVMASIRKERWAAKVVQEDFGRLKAAVADALREGDPQQARQHIEAYRREKTALNQVVASPRVAESLRTEVDQLAGIVHETFSGGPEAVMSKQKRNAKGLQYESYQDRRDDH